MKSLRAAFESLERRELLTATSVAWASVENFNQFTGDKSATAFGFGINDGRNSPGVDEPKFVGFEFDETLSAGTGIGEGLFGDKWGAEGSIAADGRFGLEYGFYANAGTATLVHDGSFQYDVVPKSNGSFDLITGINVSESSLQTISPTLSAYADVVLEMSGTASGQICVVSCTGGTEEFADVEARIPLASINRQTNAEAIKNAESNGLQVPAPVFDGDIKVFGVGIDDLNSFADKTKEAVLDGLKKAEKSLSISEGKKKQAEAKLENARTDEERTKAIKELTDADNDIRKAKSDIESAKSSKLVDDGKGKDKSVKNGAGGGIGLTVSLSQPDDLLGIKGELAVGGSIGGVLSAGKKLGDASLTLPEVNMRNTVQGDGPLRVSTSDPTFNDVKRKILDLNLSLGGILLSSYGFGETSIGLGPLSASVTPIDYILGANLSVNQTMTSNLFDHDVIAKFSSATGNPVSVTATVDGARQIGSSITFDPGANVNFLPTNTAGLQVDFEIVNKHSVFNDIGLDMGVDGTLKALELVLTAFTEELKLGPVLNWEHDLFDANLGSIFDKELVVTGEPLQVASVVLQPDLDINLLGTSPYISTESGNAFEFEVEVTNRGNAPAVGVVLGTEGLEVASLNADCVAVSGEASCTLGTLQPDASTTLTISGVTAGSGDLDLSQIFVRPNDGDANIDNNSLNPSAIPRIESATFKVRVSDDVTNPALQPMIRETRSLPDGERAERLSEFCDIFDCSLRDAVRMAEEKFGPDVIEIQPGIQPVMINPSDDWLSVTESLSVIGQGQNETFIDSPGGHFNIRSRDDRPFDMEYRFTGLGLRKVESFDTGSAIWVTPVDGVTQNVFVDDVLFENNRAFINGAGGLTAFDANVSVSNSTFIGNIANIDGGAIQQRGGSLVVSNTRFEGNLAENDGGALHIDDVGSVVLVDVVFDGNSAGRKAGAALLDASITQMFFTTVANNSAPDGSGFAFSNDTDLANLGIFFDVVLSNGVSDDIHTEGLHSFISSGQNFSTDPSAPFFNLPDDRSAKSLIEFDGYEDGRSPIIKHGATGVEVGVLKPNLLREVADFSVNDSRFEVTASNMLKLKDNASISESETRLTLEVSFTDISSGVRLTDTMVVGAMSPPKAPPSGLELLDIPGRVHRDRVRNLTTGGQILGGQRQLSWLEPAFTGYRLEITNAAGDLVADFVEDVPTFFPIGSPDGPLDEGDVCSNSGLINSCSIFALDLPFGEDLTFSLRAVNEVGESEPATLTTNILPPPSEIKQFVATNVTSNSITLDWQDADREEYYFVQQVREVNTGELNKIGDEITELEFVNSVEEFVFTDQTGATANGLRPVTNYLFQVVAVNDSGTSSALIEVTTAPPTPTAFRGLPTVESLTSTSARVSWSDVDHELKYGVVYASSGGEEQIEYFDPGATSATIGGLTANTAYEFYVVALNGVDASSRTGTVDSTGGAVDPVDSSVSGFVNSDGFIVLEGSGQKVVGLDFLSEAGLLSTEGSASPFTFFLADSPTQVTLGVLGSANAVTLDGTLVTPVKYSGQSPNQDLNAIWGNTSNDLTQFQVTTQQVNPPIVVDGLSGFIDAAGFVTLQGNGQQVVGLNLKSPEGQLVPLSSGEEAPFTFALANTTEQITLGNLGSSIEVDGILKTNVRYTGRPDRLDAVWGDTNSVQTELVFTSGSSPCAAPSLDTISDCAENLAERDAILAQLGLLVGDLDGDGGVGFPDFLKLSDSFGQTDKRYTDGDIDLDGTVGFADFLALADNFGKSA